MDISDVQVELTDIKGVYPPPLNGAPKLYGSLLECVMRDTSNTVRIETRAPSAAKEAAPPPRVSKLKENPHECAACRADAAQHTYGADYKATKPDRKLALKAWRGEPTTPLHQAARDVLDRDRGSLGALEIKRNNHTAGLGARRGCSTRGQAGRGHPP